MTRLRILPDNEQILVKPGETILQALYAAGFAYRVGCRRGGCAICKVDILEGFVTYDHPVAESVLTEAELNEGTCLTCRAVPEGDLTISLREESLQLKSSILRSLRAV